MAKSALGKGLGALISSARPTAAPPVRPPSESDIAPGDKIHHVDLHSVSPSPFQPRKEFAAEALQELVSSIREHGIIQPLIVRRTNGRHELIAGERRLRAAQELGLQHVPVIIRTADDLEVLELSL